MINQDIYNKTRSRVLTVLLLISVMGIPAGMSLFSQSSEDDPSSYVSGQPADGQMDLSQDSVLPQVLQPEEPAEDLEQRLSAETVKPLPPVLQPGTKVKNTIDLNSGANYITYRFLVPPDIMRAEIKLEDAQADLDLYVRHGSEILDYAAVDAGADSDAFNEKLVLSRFGDAGLYDGEYYLDVVYQREYPPLRNGRTLNEIGFGISVNYTALTVDRTVSPGESISGTLKPEDGMMKLYAIQTEGWDSALRIDITGTTGDIDLFISRGNPNITPDTADYRSESLLGRESMVIDGSSAPGFDPGTYYILLVDQVSDRFPLAFTLWASSSADTPEGLKNIPPIPDQDEPLQHSIGATVEVIGESGRGSGCLVSRDGYLLTNWHVVKNGENRPSDPVYIAATMDQYVPPDELFSGRVVRYDEELDLALVKIDAGRYGQPLPFAYRFPYFEFADGSAPRIGQPISILGYPANGGIGSRVSITLTRGIISGFEASPLGTFIKTDGEISFGNSGGAVFNAFGELLGLPVSIYTEGDGKLGFILPVSMIPPSWLKIIDGSH